MAQPLVSGEDLGHTSPLPASLSNKSYFDNMTAGWWVVVVVVVVGIFSKQYPESGCQDLLLTTNIYQLQLLMTPGLCPPTQHAVNRHVSCV